MICSMLEAKKLGFSIFYMDFPNLLELEIEILIQIILLLTIITFATGIILSIKIMK